MLRYRPPDGSSEKSSWLGWQESDDFPCFPHTSLGVDVLEGGKLTSDVLGRLNYSKQGFPVESVAVPIPGSAVASQDALHSATVNSRFKVLLFVTYSIIQDIISSEM